MNYRGVALDLFLSVAARAETIANLLLGKLRKSLAQPFSVGPRDVFSYILHVRTFFIIRYIYRGDQGWAAMHDEVYEIGCHLSGIYALYAS